MRYLKRPPFSGTAVSELLPHTHGPAATALLWPDPPRANGASPATPQLLLPPCQCIPAALTLPGHIQDWSRGSSACAQTHRVLSPVHRQCWELVPSKASSKHNAAELLFCQAAGTSTHSPG
uniref:Uncharacterized protein n=1 Tax=Strigops habroptila TaxID=2489341 RepID=A0A672TER3_STRHB